MKKYLSTNLAEDGREYKEESNLSKEIINDGVCSYVMVGNLKEKIQNAQRRLKEESTHIKICDKIIVKGKKIRLSEDLCSVKDVEKFLGEIDKIFLECFGNKLTSQSREDKNK